MNQQNESTYMPLYDYLVCSGISMKVRISDLDELSLPMSLWDDSSQSTAFYENRHHLEGAIDDILGLAAWKNLKHTNDSTSHVIDSIQSVPTVMRDYFRALNQCLMITAPKLKLYIKPTDDSLPPLDWNEKYELISDLLNVLAEINKSGDGIDALYQSCRKLDTAILTFPPHYDDLKLQAKAWNELNRAYMQPEDGTAGTQLDSYAPALTVTQLTYALLAMLYMWPQKECTSFSNEDYVQQIESLKETVNSLSQQIKPKEDKSQARHQEAIAKDIQMLSSGVQNMSKAIAKIEKRTRSKGMNGVDKNKLYYSRFYLYHAYKKWKDENARDIQQFLNSIIIEELRSQLEKKDISTARDYIQNPENAPDTPPLDPQKKTVIQLLMLVNMEVIKAHRRS